MEEISIQKKELIQQIKNKIQQLEYANEDIWLSSRVVAMNNIAIAQHYETLEKLIK